VKNIDRSLLTEVNYAAAKANLTQRDFVIAALVKACDGGMSKVPEIQGVVQSEVRPTVNINLQDLSLPDQKSIERQVYTNAIAGERPKRGVKATQKCPYCEVVLIEWGAQRHCNVCKRNFDKE
jgi:hypothetical protein